MEKEINNLIDKISKIKELDKKILIINLIKSKLHSISPFKNEPVDCVLWVKNKEVVANDYNPNKVAPPEMKLLETSIFNDGYTQPIVTWQSKEKSKIEVIDGFHRHRVGKESKFIKERIKGYLPVVTIRKTQEGKNDRIASTIRHNRARGKHQIDAMSEIVIELKNRNWSNSRISKQLGMDEDEILRLCQITGLQELFKDSDFSKSWEIDDSEEEFEDFTDNIDKEEINNTRAINVDDPERIFHTYDKWECVKAGFYNSTKESMSSQECEKEYYEFLKDEKLFRETLQKVTNEWKHSCEHYLTNKSMNRIAWLGQASVCYAKGIPSKFCGGFNLLSKQQQMKANSIALEFLNKWLTEKNMKPVSLEEGLAVGRQMEIY